MKIIPFTAFILLSLSIGLSAILITYQLNKRYRLHYLSTYLYFQIFINVFGIYGILGLVIVKRFLQLQATPFQTIETIGHFFSFLGFPFLILAWYMFIRLCREIIEKRLSQVFNLCYFFALTVIFTVYGLVIIAMNLFDFGEERYAYLSSITPFFYVVMEMIILLIALPQLFLKNKELKDEKKEKAILVFAWLILFSYAMSLISCLYSRKSIAFTVTFLLLFFSRNLPPILYWRSYLKRYFVAPALESVGLRTRKRFFQEFGISKREKEVIQHLCEGKTNKEISESLFISLQTVKDHIYRIYQKTDVKNRVQLINLLQSYKEEDPKEQK